MNQSRPVTGDLARTGSGGQQGVEEHRGGRGRHAARTTRDRLADNRKDEFPTEPALIAEEIARTRRELGETLEALSARMDFKTRARDGVTQAQTRVVGWVRPAARPMIGAVAGAGVAALALAVVVILQRRGVPLLRRGGRPPMRRGRRPLIRRSGMSMLQRRGRQRK